MAVTRRTARSRFTLILLVLTSITLLTLDYRGFRPIDSIRSVVLDAFAPVGDATSGVLEPVGDAWNGAFDYGNLEAENEDLRRRVEELEGEAAANRAAADELQKLSEQLDLPYVGGIPTVRTRVASGAITNFDDTIELEKGSDDGIAEGNPVVAGAGLVGTVIRVSPDRSVVRLLTDPSSQVGVRVAGRPGLGVVVGQGDEATVRATQFDVNTQLDDGDLLVTSGAARSTYPPDIPVGTVENVTTDETALQKEADVRLLAGLNDLTYVTVLLYAPPG